MKHGPKRNERKRCLIVERLEVRALLSASAFGRAVNLDSLDRTGVVERAFQNRLASFDVAPSRAVALHQQSIDGSRLIESRTSNEQLPETSPAFRARESRGEAPTQLRNSGRSISLDGNGVSLTRHRESVTSGGTPRFHQGFKKAEILPSAPGQGLRKAVAERKVGAVSPAYNSQPVASYVSTTAAFPAPSPVTPFPITSLRVFAPPVTSSTATALSRVSDSSVSSMTVSEPATVSATRDLPQGFDGGPTLANDAGSVQRDLTPGPSIGGVVDVGTNVASATVRSRVSRTLASSPQYVLGVLNQIQAIRDTVAAAASDNSDVRSLSLSGSSSSFLANGNLSTASTHISPVPVLETPLPRSSAQDSLQGTDGGFLDLVRDSATSIRRQSPNGDTQGNSGVVRTLVSQFVDELFSDRSSAAIDLTSSTGASANLAFGLNAGSSLDEQARQLDSIFAKEALELGDGKTNSLASKSNARPTVLSEDSPTDIGGFIELERGLKKSSDDAGSSSVFSPSATSEHESDTRNTRESRRHQAADRQESDSNVDTQWLAEQENAEFGGIVELADGAEQGEQWLAMNLDGTADSDALAAYDPASIEATAGVYRSIELVGALGSDEVVLPPQSVELGSEISLLDDLQLDAILFEEAVSLGEYLGTPLRKATVVVPTAMVLSAYLVRQRVQQDEEVLPRTYLKPIDLSKS